MLLDIKNMREEYSRERLDEASVDPDPIRQFSHWFEEAVKAQLPEPNAMTLATVSAEGRPSARVVLLKEADARGFVFFTNYESRKGREIAVNPRVALVFLWKELERQVRIEGEASRIDLEESTRYFDTRPRGSRIGALASPQSEVIAGREGLERRMAELEARYGPEDRIPRPDNWGGYLVRPSRFEFWQGRRSRLHDRIQYRRELEDGGAWVIERLAP
jgi:pyridoxamine 5'-phosphate oxidase